MKIIICFSIWVEIGLKRAPPSLNFLPIPSTRLKIWSQRSLHRGFVIQSAINSVSTKSSNPFCSKSCSCKEERIQVFSAFRSCSSVSPDYQWSLLRSEEELSAATALSETAQIKDCRVWMGLNEFLLSLRCIGPQRGLGNNGDEN